MKVGHCAGPGLTAGIAHLGHSFLRYRLPGGEKKGKLKIGAIKDRLTRGLPDPYLEPTVEGKGHFGNGGVRNIHVI